MPEINEHIARIIRRTDEALREHATMPSALERVLGTRNRASPAQAAPEYANALSGMSKGKVTALVAGVGLLGGGAYALMHHRRKQAESAWTDRLEAERQGIGQLIR